MARASTNFPGLEEVLQDLVDQKNKTAPSRRLPSPPTAADIEKNARRFPKPKTGQGIFNVAEGSGGAFARKALGAGVAAAPFIGPAWDLGKKMGNKVNEAIGRGVEEDGELVSGPRGQRLLNDKKYEGQSLPDLGPKPEVKLNAEQKRANDGKATAADITGSKANNAQEVTVIPGMETSTPSSSSHGESKPAVRTPSNKVVSALAGQTQEEIKPEPKAEVKAVIPNRPERDAESAALDQMESGGEIDQTEVDSDPVLSKIESMLASQPEYKMPREQVNQASLKKVNELGKNRSEPDTPKETVGRAIKRFIVAGAGPADFTRLERQESDLHQAKNRMTDREKFGGAFAAGDVMGAQQFNREAEKTDHTTGGLSPQMQFMMKMLEGDRVINQQEGVQSRRDLAQHGNRIDEMQTAAKLGKNDPETAKLMAQLKFLESNPDASPEQLEQTLGIKLDPKYIESVRAGRTKEDPMRQALVAIINSWANLNNRQGAKGPAVNTKAVEKK